ncbi:MAG: succinate dehydrogenase, cytochrome b556 subunit [candidate division Zixibacteria bacterium]|nr:succinate dehydrogenase, cytochrome b556 subunit [candidate division Zixibacteria bacterium]
MTFGKILKIAYDDTIFNKNTGNFAYLFHRITGIGLVVYLLMHTYVLSSAISGKESFTKRMGMVQNPLFAILEVALVAGVFFHMLNGVRVSICDFFGLTRAHKLFFWIELALFVIIMVIAVVLQWPKMQPGYYSTM